MTSRGVSCQSGDAPDAPAWTSRGGNGGATVGLGVGEGESARVLDCQGAVGCLVELPAVLVSVVVVSRTQRHQTMEVGTTSMGCPVVEVVDLTAVEGDVAAIEGTRAVHSSQRSTLGGRGQASGSAQIEGHRVTAEDHRKDLGITGKAPGDRGGNGFTVAEFAHPGTGEVGNEAVVVDDHRHLSFGRPLPLVTATDEIDQRPSRQGLVVDLVVVGTGPGGDFGVDGSEEAVSGDGVELAGDAVHAGAGIDPAAKPGVAPLALRSMLAPVGGQPVGRRASMRGERLDRRRFGPADEAVMTGKELSALGDA